MKRHIKLRLGTSFFSKKASQGKARHSLEDKVPGSFIPPCEHDRGGYCAKLKTMPKAHCSKDYMKVCGKVKTFYDKWGENGNYLGVGS